jgi:hypothetical protein
MQGGSPPTDKPGAVADGLVWPEANRLTTLRTKATPQSWGVLHRSAFGQHEAAVTQEDRMRPVALLAEAANLLVLTLIPIGCCVLVALVWH